MCRGEQGCVPLDTRGRRVVTGVYVPWVATRCLILAVMLLTPNIVTNKSTGDVTSVKAGTRRSNFDREHWQQGITAVAGHAAAAHEKGQGPLEGHATDCAHRLLWCVWCCGDVRG